MKKLPAAVLASLSVGFVAVVLSLTAIVALKVNHSYGYSLFLLAPTVAGAVATFLHAQSTSLRIRDVFAVTSMVALLSSLCLLLAGAEGLVCLFMSLPVSLPAAWLGGFIAFAIAKAMRTSGPTRGASLALFPPLWLALAIEPRIVAPPDLVAVSTSVEIHADAAAVWRNVVAFPPITSPLSPLFKAGIAYPTSATIDGTGVGAIRRCVFSTGVFVEPITVWEGGRRLEFDVAQSPPPLRETSFFYKDLEVPHLRHTFSSERGRFLLSPNRDGTITLEGTTWYRQKLWPQVYWNAVVNQIVHRIHRRVLDHIKATAEAAAVSYDE